jgi:hypothetical protein
VGGVRARLASVREHPRRRGWKLATLVVENAGDREVTVDEVEYRWKDWSSGERIVDLSLGAGETLTLKVAVPGEFLEEGESLAVIYFVEGEASIPVEELRKRLEEGWSGSATRVHAGESWAKLTERILLLLAMLLARLTGLDELLDAITLPLLFLEYYRLPSLGARRLAEGGQRWRYLVTARRRSRSSPPPSRRRPAKL